MTIKHKHLLPLLAALAVAGAHSTENQSVAITADKDAAPAASETKTVTAENALGEGIEYSDAKECHIKIGGAGETMSVIHALIASRGMAGSNNDQLRIALGTAIANGCDLNEPDQAGFQPLNAAILFNDAEIVTLLLEKGADPYLTIHKPGRSIDGSNSFDFLKKIEEKEKSRDKAPDRSAIRSALQKYR